MRKLLPFLSLVLLAFVFQSETFPTPFDKTQTVNPILGDASFIQKYGFAPDARTDNELRICTHLEFVEKQLRTKDVSHLPERLQTQRLTLLNHLQDYVQAGVFPKNYDYANQRKPCFIDQDGNICAVGYLVEQSAGRAAAEYLNQKFKYEELLDMNDAVLEEWVTSSGFTKRELAMIQPAYAPPSTIVDNYISNKNAVLSSVFGGVNLSLNVMNALQIGQKSGDQFVPILGLATGLGQVIYGSVTLPEDYSNLWTGTRIINESQQKLSMLNIGLGTATVLMSSWNLIFNRHNEKKLTHWNLHTVPMPNQGTGVALSVWHRF